MKTPSPVDGMVDVMPKPHGGDLVTMNTVNGPVKITRAEAEELLGHRLPPPDRTPVQSVKLPAAVKTAGAVIQPGDRVLVSLCGHQLSVIVKAPSGNAFWYGLTDDPVSGHSISTEFFDDDVSRVERQLGWSTRWTEVWPVDLLALNNMLRPGDEVMLDCDTHLVVDHNLANDVWHGHYTCDEGVVVNTEFLVENVERVRRKDLDASRWVEVWSVHRRVPRVDTTETPLENLSLSSPTIGGLPKLALGDRICFRTNASIAAFVSPHLGKEVVGLTPCGNVVARVGEKPRKDIEIRPNAIMHVVRAGKVIWDRCDSLGCPWSNGGGEPVAIVPKSDGGSINVASAGDVAGILSEIPDMPGEEIVLLPGTLKPSKHTGTIEADPDDADTFEQLLAATIHIEHNGVNWRARWGDLFDVYDAPDTVRQWLDLETVAEDPSHAAHKLLERSPLPVGFVFRIDRQWNDPCRAGADWVRWSRSIRIHADWLGEPDGGAPLELWCEVVKAEDAP